MPEIRSTRLGLSVDGRTIELKNERKGNFALNRALAKPEGFREFAANPAAFAAKYHFEIDETLSKQLAERLAGIESIRDLRDIVTGGGFTDPADKVGATLWAVAEGSYSVSSSKVAVAF